MTHRHRLCCRSALIEHRGIGHFHPGEITDHRLEVQQGFETTLTDLRLVRSVGGVPAGRLQDAALDGRRCDAVVVTGSDVTTELLIAGRQILQLLEYLRLRRRIGEGEIIAQANRLRDSPVDQTLQ